MVSLHGCTTSRAGLPDGTQAVLVGGLNTTLKQYLMESLAAVGIQAEDASGSEGLGGVNPANIMNRTLLGQGAQLEITTPLRTVMFGTNTRAGRKNTTTQVFWDVVHAVRQAVGRIEAEQIVA
ncbi:poly-gamma-glutamate hydrolase family protein [Streptomyces sp. NBC_00286]|uniref:poly-gamma-glutamate hydrolase family protein n=1 Tax=Streptomyces sp. NBC_00286 TaxID=2975701 RepID=UPI003FA6FC21